MKQLDKMLKQARKSHDKRQKEVSLCEDIKVTRDIHILKEGYCYLCQGECKYKNRNNYIEAGRYKAIFIHEERIISDEELERIPEEALDELIKEAKRQVKEDEAVR